MSASWGQGGVHFENEPSLQTAQDAIDHAMGKESSSLLRDIDAYLKNIYCYMLRVPRSCFPAAPYTVIS